MTRFEQLWTSDVLTAFTQEEVQGLIPLPGEVDYLKAFRKMRNGSTALCALGLRIAIWMVAFAPLWLLGRFVTFSELARAERTQLLSRLLAHKNFAVRELTLLLKLTAAMAIFGTASIRARSGHDAASPARADHDARRQLTVLQVDAEPSRRAS
ncbi:MAG TPA: hypothetical protein VHZ95_03655 [Polyangiales bacterium]|jgi:hypothetical protein|nr:hypothetical protein [Polyangiales bacterium]